MASISLPFGLTRPSPTESVTNATEIDDLDIGKTQSEINEELYSALGDIDDLLSQLNGDGL